MKQGKIAKLYEHGFGFIRLRGRGDLFFHRSAVEGVSFEALQEGQAVGFERLWDSSQGRFYATGVHLLETTPMSKPASQLAGGTVGRRPPSASHVGARRGVA